MEILASVVYQELDPAKKDYKWADRCITQLRMDWRPLVNPVTVATNREYLYSIQSMQRIEQSFQDAEFKRDFPFNPLPIMENLLNTIVEEVTKDPPHMEVKAVDPAAINLKKKDIDLWKSRAWHERNISGPQMSIGLPAYKMDYSKFAGNIEDADKEGLNPDDPEEVNLYETYDQKLKCEIACQSLIDNVFKSTRFDDHTLRRLMKDAMACKAVATQVYVDQITGEIKNKYIDLLFLRGVWGTTNDGKNDICRGWEESLTLSEWMARVGDEFDFDKDWPNLLWAINYTNNFRFTGFIRNGRPYGFALGGQELIDRGMGDIKERNDCNLDFSQAYKYKVQCGYIEWKSNNATGSYKKRKNAPQYVEPVPYSYELSHKEIREEYCKEDYFQEQWYRSYFLASSSMTQWLYGFQKVYYQHLEGANDEYSNGTISYWQEEGLSSVEIAKNYIEVANFAFFRMAWIIYKAKPELQEYQYEELIQLATKFKKEYGQNAPASQKIPGIESILGDVLNYQKKNHVRIRVFPNVNGQPIPQNNTIDRKDTGGLDQTAIAMQSITAWAEMQVAQKIGINPIRLGANPQARSSFDSQQEVKEASANTTSFMYRMIQFVKQHNASTVFNYAMDIVKYPDSVPYKWLCQQLGDDTINGIKSLESMAPHKWGIYVNDYNYQVDKAKVTQAADQALMSKTISFMDWLKITQSQDFKRAAQLLEIKQRQNDKKLRAQQLEDMQIQDQMSANQFQRDMQLIQAKGQQDNQGRNIDGQYQLQAAQINADNKAQVKQMQIDSDVPKQIAKTEGQKQIDANKQDLKNQEPYQVQQQV